MKRANHKLTGAVLAVQCVLTATVLAHPGSPGHTHEDDWPFGPLSLVAIGAIAAAAAAGMVWKRRKPARLRRSR